MNRFISSNFGIQVRLATRLFFALSALCVLCGYTSAQEWKTVADGVEHAQVRREFSGKPVDINLLRLDLKKVRLDVHHAMDMAIGLETTSSIAKRHGALAAINSGFFRLDTSLWAGDSTGVMIIDGEIISDPMNDRIALGLRNDPLETEAAIGRSELEQILFLGKQEIEITGTNRELAKDEIVLYTPYFHRTTLTRDPQLEVTVRRNRITKIAYGLGSSIIPDDGYVISASGSHAENLMKIVRVGGSIQIGRRTTINRTSHEPDPPMLVEFEDVVAGVPQLIKAGKIDITWEQEKTTKAFVETRHPRTAVAKLKDGRFLMLTADGRTEQSAGLDLYDLAAYMLELGAVDAMNLDGGGSTTMYLDGKVVNRVSDKEGERKIGDAILVTLRNKRKR